MLLKNMAAAIEFEVTEKLREYGVKRIVQIGSMLKVDYNNKPITTTFDVENITASMKRFRKDAGKVITSNGVAASDIIEDLAIQITKEASRVYEEENSKNGKGSSTWVDDVPVTAALASKMAPKAARANCTIEEWRATLKAKYNNLKTVADEQLPGLWLPLEFGLSVRCIIHIKNISLPFIAIILGPPSSNKTLAVDQFKGARNIFTTDQFSPKAFVSHNSGLTEEQLRKIDLLPKIKNKMFLTSELSPLFTTKDDDLANVFGIITRIADGNGYFSDTGAQGHRGYGGPMMFVWLGAAVDIPYKVHKMLSALGPKLYFIRLPLYAKTEEDIVYLLQQDDFRKRLETVSKAFFDYLEYLESCPDMEPDTEMDDIPRLEWNAANPIEEQAQFFIAKLAKLLAHLRGTVSTWETMGTQGLEYAYSTAYIEDHTRAATQLYNLARGHALSQGREHVTIEDDLPLIVKVVLSGAASIERVKVLSALLDRQDQPYLNVNDITDITGTSEKTAKKTMAEFKALGLVDLIRLTDGDNGEIQIRLKDGFKWFLTEEFRKLKGDYMPGDFREFMAGNSRTKITPHVEKNIFSSADDNGKAIDSYSNNKYKEEDSNNNDGDDDDDV